MPKSKQSETEEYLYRMCPKCMCSALSVSTAVIILHMVILHDMHQPCGLLMSVPVTHYINIIILIIGAYNMTPDLWPILHNTWLMYCYGLFRSIVLSLLIQTYPRHISNYSRIICTNRLFILLIYSHMCMCKRLSDLSVI